MRKPVHPKVKAGGTAGAVAILVVFALQRAGVTLGPTEAAAVGTVLSAAGGWVKRA